MIVYILNMKQWLYKSVMSSKQVGVCVCVFICLVERELALLYYQDVEYFQLVTHRPRLIEILDTCR